MQALINSIVKDSETPEQFREYIFKNLDTDSPDGLALYDVLYFICELYSLPKTYSVFRKDGRVFHELAEIVILKLQAIPDYDSLQVLIRNLSSQLEPLKDEHGFIDLVNVTLDDARGLVEYFNDEKKRPRAKEQLPGC